MRSLLLRRLFSSTTCVSELATYSDTINKNNYWMPFTDNVNFKKNPKILHRADGVHYYLEDGTQILDGMSGLWCVNAGHRQPKIEEAIKSQLQKYSLIKARDIIILCIFID